MKIIKTIIYNFVLKKLILISLKINLNKIISISICIALRKELRNVDIVYWLKNTQRWQPVAFNFSVDILSKAKLLNATTTTWFYPRLNLIRYHMNESTFSVLVVLFVSCFFVIDNLSPFGKIVLRCLHK